MKSDNIYHESIVYISQNQVEITKKKTGSVSHSLCIKKNLILTFLPYTRSLTLFTLVCTSKNLQVNERASEE